MTPDNSAALLEELAAAFRRHRPQNNARWNFTDAFMRLEREFGAWVTGSDLLGTATGTASPPPGPVPAPSLLRRVKRRLVGTPAPTFQTTAEIQADGRGRVASGFDATLEAFRYLALRVSALEDALARTDSPIDGLADLVPVPDLGPWFDTIRVLLERSGLPGPVIHLECGDGSLVAELRAAGFDASGADPRGAPVTAGLERGLPLAIADARSHLVTLGTSSLGALVLSGVVDRLGLGDVVDLLDLARDCLSEDAPLIVVTQSTAGTRHGWSEPARDLVPGRPLHGETWALLLNRVGFADVETQGESEGAPAGLGLITGRKLT